MTGESNVIVTSASTEPPPFGNEICASAWLPEIVTVTCALPVEAMQNAIAPIQANQTRLAAPCLIAALHVPWTCKHLAAPSLRETTGASSR
ncbi:MAG TPA: hypothetical protein VFE12_14400 [Acetobacteraceae bacterium]|nr:hypothetical protein [Acetobacteraceae bacterium]